MGHLWGWLIEQLSATFPLLLSQLSTSCGCRLDGVPEDTLWYGKVQGRKETISSCISPLKSEEIFLRVYQHNTPQILLDRILSDASSQTRCLQGEWYCGLGSVGKECCGSWVDNTCKGILCLGSYRIGGLAGRKKLIHSYLSCLRVKCLLAKLRNRRNLTQGID